MAIVKLVTKEPNQHVVALLEEMLTRAKAGDIVCMVAGCATADAWETNVSEGTPMLEAMGYMDFVKSVLLNEYIENQ